MRSDRLLDYAIFQLTPTRTRCELHVAAQGFTYKLASGLLKPFVSHLRAAEEQLARGGYSIRLEPPDAASASWFTKGTMERFVLFVSTPEVLERVSTIELEVSQLENSISAHLTASSEVVDNIEADKQSTKNAGTGTAYASLESFSKFVDVADNEVEESSKQRLLRALSARCAMLQKDQGMAFARAIAAGFSIEQMDDLVAFSECFGANRLREACKKFIALCKKRQEAGLWLEDLNLAASENYQHDMTFSPGVHEMATGYIKCSRGYADCLIEQGIGGIDVRRASFPVEGKLWMRTDGPDKLTRRASRHDLTADYMKGAVNAVRLANGNAGIVEDNSEPRDLDRARENGLVNGHPMMLQWPGQKIPNHFLAHGVRQPTMTVPCAFPSAMKAGAVPYPPYMGNACMYPPYGDNIAWQGGTCTTHSHVTSQCWQGSQGYGSNLRPFVSEASNVPNGVSMPSWQHSSHIASVKQPSGLGLGARFGSDEQENGGCTEFNSDIDAKAPLQTTRMHARRSASPRRRSASPMRRVHIGRVGQQQHPSGMVVIRNIKYIPNSQGPTKGDREGESSGSWSEEEEENEDGRDEAMSETGRTNLHDIIRLFESKKVGLNKKLCKKEARKLSSENAELESESAVNSGKASSQLLGKAASTVEINKVSPSQGRIDESAVEPKPRIPSNKDEGAQMLVDIAMVPEIQSYKQHDVKFIPNREEHKFFLTDDSFIDCHYVSAKHATGSADSGYEFSGKLVEDFKQQKLEKLPSDDSFMVIDRLARPFNSDFEKLNMGDTSDTKMSEGFEPSDLLMVPDRDRMVAKMSWGSSHDIQMYVADMMERAHGELNDADYGEAELTNGSLEQKGRNKEEKRKKMTARKLSERDAKANAMQEMLERRKAGADRRINPLTEAQRRADKLQVYKAGLQECKQQKEEEERKRKEDLRRQRQERIAARSNSGGNVQSPSSKAKVVNKATTPIPMKSFSPKQGSTERCQTVKGFSSSSWSKGFKPSFDGSRVAWPPLSSQKALGSAVSHSFSSIRELQKVSNKSSPLPFLRSSTGLMHPSLPKKIDKELESSTLTVSNEYTEEKKNPMACNRDLKSPFIAKRSPLAEGKKCLALSAGVQKVLPAKEQKVENMGQTRVPTVQSSPASNLQKKLATLEDSAPVSLENSLDKVTINNSLIAELLENGGTVEEPESSSPSREVTMILESNGDAHSIIPSFGELNCGVTMPQTEAEEPGSEVGPSVYQDHANLMDIGVIDDVPSSPLDDSNGISPPLEPPSASSLPTVIEESEHYAPDPPQYTTPNKDLPRLFDAIRQAHSPETSPLHSENVKSRKKWGEKAPKDHTKVLKRLFLLGRRSNKNSLQNSMDVTLGNVLSEADGKANQRIGTASINGTDMGKLPIPC